MLSDYIPNIFIFHKYSDHKIYIVDIKCGSEHNLAIDKNGRVFCWGLNAQRQCGIASKSFLFKPEMIESLKEYKICHVECGHRHSYCKAVGGAHFLFGSNEHNECLTFDGRKKVATPFYVNDIVKQQCNGKCIKSVSLGYCNTKLILRNPNKQFAARRYYKGTNKYNLS